MLAGNSPSISVRRWSKPCRNMRRVVTQVLASGLMLSGSSSVPTDSVSPVGTACAFDSNVCTRDECDGKGACTAPSAPDGSACGGNPDLACCGGQPLCVDFDSDSDNCGRCGNACPGLKECDRGQCCETCNDGSGHR